MIRTTKVYQDKSGGLRLYIPMDMAAELGWKDHEEIILKLEDGEIRILAETVSSEKVKGSILSKIKNSDVSETAKSMEATA